MKNHDVIIIGAGPAGLGAAYELGSSGYSVLVIDKGKDIRERRCNNHGKGIHGVFEV